MQDANQIRTIEVYWLLIEQLYIQLRSFNVAHPKENICRYAGHITLEPDYPS